ncbi:Glycosyl hydrolase family 26 [Actinacidiphila yanglinensis]|uniref:Glycosyl hydrolase family 26 n=1 Tax=Actinacidiphila yanglinensis TaxID=310779 RepID=A0A1H6B640_9ACTN|nr:glycosyl hydrolase [Actinacidiphila yanglinensis]SEG56100.1 Glycosyl hydrolase family 26 [Actinacidiphila yanglinensis]
MPDRDPAPRRGRPAADAHPAAPGPGRRRFVGLAGATAGLGALSALSAHPALAAPPAGPAPHGPHPVPARRIGAYHWDRQPGQIGDFAEWINSPVYYAEDFLLRDSWASLAGAGRLSSWQDTPWARRMVWAAYPFPDGQGDLVQAAAGVYNSHYADLAGNLVRAGMGNAVLRFGHEFNGNWYPWSPANDPNGVAAGETDFAAAFRQFATTVRAVPGAHFTLVWNPVPGQSGIDLTRCYPGDAYVDLVGIDIYDQDWNVYSPGVPPTEALRERAWQDLRTDPHWGIDMIAAFAASRNKRLAVPEWGVWWDKVGHGGVDNAYFVQQMFDWMNANDVAWNVYFNVYASDGNHDLYDTYLFPEASARFQRLWNPSGRLPRPRPVSAGTLHPSGAPGPTAYPPGTAVVAAHTGSFSQPSGTRARPYGDPWAEEGTLASLIRAGAGTPPEVSYPDAPAAEVLMLRYECPVDGDVYLSVYVDGVKAAGQVRMPAVDRTRPTEYAMVTVPVHVPAGATVTVRIDPDDDHTVSGGVWDYVNLDTIGFAAQGAAG